MFLENRFSVNETEAVKHIDTSLKSSYLTKEEIENTSEVEAVELDEIRECEEEIEDEEVEEEEVKRKKQQ